MVKIVHNDNEMDFEEDFSNESEIVEYLNDEFNGYLVHHPDYDEDTQSVSGESDEIIAWLNDHVPEHTDFEPPFLITKTED
jgi:hypothetical protein